MHYYKFDISAWALHTAHLTPEEEAVYFRLINFYYDTEHPIPVELAPVMRKLRMVSCIHVAETILAEFFQPSPEGWRHNRCDKEIADYHAKADRNREIGKLGGRPRKNPDVTQTVSAPIPPETPTTNYKLQTTNQKKKTRADALPPDGVLDATWSDFLALRKTKRAPVTDTAIRGIAREAAKASMSLENTLRMCCERGWTGFKAEWVTTPTAQQKTPPSGNLAAARAIFGDERQLNAQPDFILEEGYVNDRTPKIA